MSKTSQQDTKSNCILPFCQLLQLLQLIDRTMHYALIDKLLQYHHLSTFYSESIHHNPTTIQFLQLYRLQF